MPFVATWMDLETLIIIEVSQTNIMISFNMWKLKKMTQMNLFIKQKQTHRLE